MRSSISATKILAFYIILLYLFLRTKMCAGAVRARKSISDSDINYYDSDESFLSAPGATSAPLDSTSGPVEFGNNNAKTDHLQQAGTTPRAHHVRHEHHYAKNRHITQAEQALRAYKNGLRTVNSRMDRHGHTNHHRPQLRHQKMHHHSSRHTFRLQNRVRSRHRTPLVSVMDGLKSTRLNRSNFSNSNLVNQYTSRFEHRRADGLEPLPSAVALPVTRTVKKSIIRNNSLFNRNSTVSNPYGKNYFEDLLNSYKTYSPYYKDHQQKDTSQLTKSLSASKGKCNGKKCKNLQTKEEDDDYDYEYEEDDEDDDDEDEEEEYDDTNTQGDAGYSTTLSPSTENPKRPVTNSHNSGSNENIDATNSFSKEKQDHDKEVSSESVTEGRIIQKEAHLNALSHVAKIRREGACSTPKPKMILASNDPSKQYTPHCTILHRCGDDVGCCLPTQTCAASKNSTVELYFFVHKVGSRPSIERLSFINHTECACFSRHDSLHRRTSLTSTPSPILAAPVCTCPSLFQRVIDNDNRCFCDCSSSDAQCDQFKRGNEHFSMENRRCINNGRCQEPVCEYGNYNKAKGKCPTREDKLSFVYNG